ncbi:hypothetical protein P691DRAFT_677919 [Macrolepiota fuliginosa MF-IS2]|uniref:Zn(2)-C6 fungal-type domain-containing protein n=1 Tax=Macrolepiota fuliginosa MF-IS2 TaxID=1400762 RepID=A0A9P5X473_9AGAR|nr:hypothetical protein P691DRAFT_677919 [Macrolepiota fuliginosa MF-IS2]
MPPRYSPPVDGYSDPHSSNQPILKKGRACANCRRRKMRCDGLQPICGSCMRTDKAEDCEYTTGSERSTSQKLEEEIERLQTKLRHLQTPSQPTQSLTLQQPYAPESRSRLPSPDLKEPPQYITQILVDIFLAHGSQYGFFLHPGRFRSSVFFSGPVGHGSRPSPSLLSVMYLLGIHLSQDPEIKRHEKTYFDFALHQVAQDTVSITSQVQHRLHVIQAEVILSHYFFSNKRMLEGKYHLNSAYSLCIASGIHKMKTSNPLGCTLPPANDDIEEGERVNACWAIFTLDKGWAGVMNYTPNFSSPNVGGVRIDTPFPREIEEYESGHYRCERREAAALNNFIANSEHRGETLTSRTFHVKAAFLYEQARALSQASTTQLSGKQQCEFTDSFLHFRNLAMGFKSSLPPFETWLRNPNMDIVRTAYVACTLLDAALIRFHGIAAAQGDEKAPQLRMISAQETFNNSIRLMGASWNFGFLDPIIGFAWREAFDVLLEELNIRSAQFAWAARHCASEEDPLRRQLRKGVSSFAIYRNSSSFISHEVEGMTNLLHGTPIMPM